jgi:Ala-tRNA(Pro) deacylase
MNDQHQELSVLARLREFLSNHDVRYREVEHEPTFTSQQSADARGEPLKVGGKALLMKAGDDFVLLVIPADRQLASSPIRKMLGVKKMRFATREELLELTTLVPGCVPPFGNPVLPFPLYVDQHLTENDRVAFNAGSLTISFIISIDDYLRVAQPKIASLTK